MRSIIEILLSQIYTKQQSVKCSRINSIWLQFFYTKSRFSNWFRDCNWKWRRHFIPETGSASTEIQCSWYLLSIDPLLIRDRSCVILTLCSNLEYYRHLTSNSIEAFRLQSAYSTKINYSLQIISNNFFSFINHASRNHTWSCVTGFSDIWIILNEKVFLHFFRQKTRQSQEGWSVTITIKFSKSTRYQLSIFVLII